MSESYGDRWDSKQNVIIYASVDGNDLIYGFDGDDTLSISGGAYSTTKGGDDIIVTVGDGHTLALDDGLSPTTKKAAFSLSGSTATYKSSYKTAGYKIASDSKSISYSKATTASTLATIKGAKSKTGLSISGKKITLKKSALKSKVTFSGGAGADIFYYKSSG